MPKKLCPKCKTGCGPRTKVCECGYDFYKGKQTLGVTTSDSNVHPKEIKPEKGTLDYFADLLGGARLAFEEVIHYPDDFEPDIIKTIQAYCSPRPYTREEVDEFLKTRIIDMWGNCTKQYGKYYQK